MALVLGTNCGFVTVAPSADPDGSVTIIIDRESNALEHTSPAGNNQVTEIGWYAQNATEAANFEVGIYTDNDTDSEPEAVVGSLNRTNAKGTTAGWKVVTGLSIPLDASTKYWIAFQLDNTTTASRTDNNNSGGQGQVVKASQTTLPSPWGASFMKNANAKISIYAKVEEVAPGGPNPKVKVSGTFATKKTLVKIGGTFTEKPVKVKVGGVFQ